MKLINLRNGLLLLLCLFVASACDHDDPDPQSFEAQTKLHVGEYKLSAVHWSGLAVDLNNDGTSRWELLDDEMSKMIGYLKLKQDAEVEINSIPNQYGDRPSLNVMTEIPYPFYELTEEGIRTNHIAYLPLTLQMVYYDHFSSRTIQHVPNEGTTDRFLSNLEEIFITNFEPDSFIINVKCSMYTNDQQKSTNYLQYHYVRK